MSSRLQHVTTYLIQIMFETKNNYTKKLPNRTNPCDNDGMTGETENNKIHFSPLTDKLHRHQNLDVKNETEMMKHTGETVVARAW